MVLDHLESFQDLDLKLLPCDAVDKKATCVLVTNQHPPIAGCMLLAAVLEDKPFESQTHDTFARVFEPKVGAYHTLCEALDINLLDFLIGFTSISGLFGNAGQTNYAR